MPKLKLKRGESEKKKLLSKSIFEFEMKEKKKITSLQNLGANTTSHCLKGKILAP